MEAIGNTPTSTIALMTWSDDVTTWNDDVTTWNDDVTTWSVYSTTNTTTAISTAFPVVKPNYSLIRDVYFYAMAVVIPTGLLLNLFSVAVFLSSTTLRKTTTGHYLIALSIADAVFMAGELCRWMNTSYQFQESSIGFMNDYNIACKTVYFLRYAAKLVSAWVTVAITTERFISITFPMRVATISTPFRAKVVIVIITLAGTAMGAFPFWTVGKTTYRGSVLCLIIDAGAYEAWSMAVLRIGTLALPSVIIITLTILILYQLGQARKRRRTMGTVSKNGVESQLTAMLLAVAVSFLLLRLPYTVSYYINNYKRKLWVPLDVWLSYRIYVSYKITDIIAASNYGINFFLYCLCGSAFRKQICNRKKRRSLNTNKAITSSKGNVHRSSTPYTISGAPNQVVFGDRKT